MKMNYLALLLLGCGAIPGHAATLTTLDSFNGTDGSNPQTGLVADAAGNLFGTTLSGGSGTYGTVYELVKSGTTYGAPITLVNFNNTNGSNPIAGLTIDDAGNLIGPTETGGQDGAGTVYELPKSGGLYGSLTTLSIFNGTNGTYPITTMTADSSGNLFGTTLYGGTGVGSVYEIAKTGSTYSAPVSIASFTIAQGFAPFGALIADSAGDLFGTAGAGGPSGDGMVFEIPKTGSTYGAITPLADFDGADGNSPVGGLAFDAAGDLFGTTQQGGTSNHGTIFEIADTGGTYGALTTLANFGGANGNLPQASLLVDSHGNLFGTTVGGGASGDGSVFELPDTGSGYGTIDTLASFTGGYNSTYAGLYADASGDLFGTTPAGGTYGDGTIFEVTGSGFGQVAAPEPGSLVLFGVGLAGLAGLRRRNSPANPASLAKPGS